MKSLDERFSERLCTTELIRDGIVDPATWKSSHPKLLYVLKEAYDTNDPNKGWDLRDFAISKSCKGKAFRELAYWTHCIRYGIDELPSLYLDDAQQASILKTTAIINLKKVPEGRICSDYKDLQHYVDRYRDLLFEQIEQIDAEIVVCGSTWRMLKKIIRSSPHSNRVHIAGNRFFVDFWHPANQFPRLMNCATLVSVLRSAGVVA